MNAAESALPSGPRLVRLLGGRAGFWLLAAGLVLVTALHLRIHMGILATPWPVTLREAAFILQTEAILDPQAPAMYSPESLPEQTNLYGPLYPLAAAPLAALLPNEPYLAHRITVSLFLLGACGLLGWSAARHGGRLAGCIVAVFFYAATVASPSLAAGPDMLATFLYVATIVVARELGCTRRALALATVLSLLALMAKPYAVWALPCLLAYTAWRHSLRRALFAGAGVLLAIAAWAWTANLIWPDYFSSVFLIHAQAASRHFFILRNQVLEFSWLNFAPLLLVLGFAPYRHIGAALRDWRWSRDGAPTEAEAREQAESMQLWPLFMTAGAAAPLLGSMGWHAGAHLIYFNHLLLPPLLLAGFAWEPTLNFNFAKIAARTITLLNCGVLLLLLPASPSAPPQIDLSNEGRTLVDPLLEPLRRQAEGVDVVDNGQAEYWIRSALNSDDLDRREHALKWENDLSAKIAQGYYDKLILAPTGAHMRRPLWGPRHLSPNLANNYDVTGQIPINIYYAHFRSRSLFGRHSIPVYVLSRRNETAVAQPK